MPDTTINTMHMAETVCRQIMRDLPDAPIRLDIAQVTPAGIEHDYERTSAARLMDQWTVLLIPTLDFVTVTANGRLHGFGLYDQIDIGGVNRIGPEYDYVTFPEGGKDDPSLVAGEQYVALLRSSVERAVAAVEADYAAAKTRSDR